jgi:Flp pilus assembly protein TadD
MIRTPTEGRDLQTPFDAAVVIPTVLRPSLAEAVRSVFAQDLQGRVQILIGIDIAEGDRALLDTLAAECPAGMALSVLDLGYSTSVRHGGLYANQFSGALRTLLTFAANSRRVAYLDDDNWWAPNHLSSLAAAMEGAHWAYSKRWFVHPGAGRPMAVDDRESVGPDAGHFAERFGGFVDTSSLMIDKLACPEIAALWSGAAFEDGSGEDRLVFQALKSGHPGRASGAVTSFYRMDPRDSMHLHRLQAFRDQGIALPDIVEAGIRPLAEILAPFRKDTVPAVQMSVPDDLLVRELTRRLRPREIVVLGLAEEPALLGLAAAALASQNEAAIAVTEPGPQLPHLLETLGFGAAVTLLPAEIGDPGRWLVAAKPLVDLVYIGEASADRIAELCTQAWAMLRQGGMVLGEGVVEDHSGFAREVQGFALAAGTALLPATLHGRHRWLLEKDEPTTTTKVQSPKDAAQALYDQGFAAHQQGDVHEASRFYQEALKQVAAHAPSLHMLGVIALQIGHAEVAIQLTGAAVEADGGNASYRNDLGEALRLAGRLDEAGQQFEAALDLAPEMGSIHNNLGILRQVQRRLEEAVPLFRRAVALMPDAPTIHMNLGVVLMEQGDLEGATAALEAARALAPTLSGVQLNLGNVQLLSGDAVAAEALYDQVLAGNPLSVEALANRARALREQGKLTESLAAYATLRQQAPDHPTLAWNEGLSHLLNGDLAQGWAGFARRVEAGAAPAVALEAPEWRGGDLAGRRLLVHAEQGLGDTLQFIRFLPQLKRFNPGSVGFICQAPLLPLLPRIEGVDQIVGPDAPLPPHNTRISLLDLPHHLGITLSDLPGPVPYVAAPAARVAEWRDRLADLEGKRVGFAWKGRREHGNDRLRSLPVSAVASLLRLPDVSWLSLQKEATGIERATLEANGFLADLAPDLTDMAETAAVVNQLDLVITADTSLAHLAGALGVPVWILLPYAPDWRWLLGRADSPWYPSARLFRQERPGDWAGVIRQVQADLMKLRQAAP